jgi:hypothetical protein
MGAETSPTTVSTDILVGHRAAPDMINATGPLNEVAIRTFDARHRPTGFAASLIPNSRRQSRAYGSLDLGPPGLYWIRPRYTVGNCVISPGVWKWWNCCGQHCRSLPPSSWLVPNPSLAPPPIARRHPRLRPNRHPC